MVYSYFLDWLLTSFSVVASVTTVIATLISAYAAARQLKPSKAIDGGISPLQVREIEQSKELGPKPFEISALANYYNQVLKRANLAFVFSILFASIGFCVIIFAFSSHSTNDLAGTIVKVASGAIIDAVSGLFFVQSTSAQRNMGDFFEKLRLDRLNAEARELIGGIHSPPPDQAGRGMARCGKPRRASARRSVMKAQASTPRRRQVSRTLMVAA